MTKSELIEHIANVVGITKATAKRVVDAIIDGITGALKKGNSVTITGFGTFKVSKRAARTGRNPRTGDTIQIPAQKTPTFKSGKGLKDAVR